MRSSSVLAASLLALACVSSLQSCSAGGTAQKSVGVEDAPGQAPQLPASSPAQSGGPNSGAGFMIDDQALIDANGKPINVGSETVCDGIDENNNGITDDVDKGRDGLCDCLHIDFLDALTSDAGNRTDAFETWLEARSDVPVAHIGARDTITADALKDLQVLVIGNLAERRSAGGYSAAEVEALQQWIQVDGGGLMSLAGYTSTEQDITPTVALLAPTGLSYDYQSRGSGVFNMVVGPPPAIVHGIVAPDHPSVEGIQALGVFHAYPVLGDGQVIVRENNFNLAMAKEIGAGHVYAFADEWITQDVLWSPIMRPLTPCQQSCSQCTNQCSNCDTQCANCQLQPCEGGQQVPEGATCRRGCDQACTQCATNCQTCKTACAACSALEQDDTLDIPRFWLNVIRWLTPVNECQVPVPPTIVY
jgi:hypothetical protein